MKNLYLIGFLFCTYTSYTQVCPGLTGANLLGAKGTFSAPFITVKTNTGANTCLDNGTATFRPVGNVGNALVGCATAGNLLPCSNYTYTSASGGLGPEGRYSILKTIGDASGGNCIKGDWRGSDHTGNGGYFMAVNGAPSSSTSPIFYQIKSIPVCSNTTYQFSAWVINLLPSTSGSATPGSEPNISFRINGTTIIANSGPIAYNNTATWVLVGGSFTTGATQTTVDLEVLNATVSAGGNDLGLDDINLSVCDALVNVTGQSTIVGELNCVGFNTTLTGKITDVIDAHNWYVWQKSTDGGTAYVNVTTPTTGIFASNTIIKNFVTPVLTAADNGTIYRMIAATTEAGLTNPECKYYNDYMIRLAPLATCITAPVSLLYFNGNVVNSNAVLSWATSTEFNNAYFDVEKSNNGIDFVKVGTLATKNNFSNIQQTYTLTDVTFSNTTSKAVYYRLKQVDIDGRAKYYNVVKLTRTPSQVFSVNAYPNPVVNNLQLNINALTSNQYNVKIINSQGKVMQTSTSYLSKGNNTITINNILHYAADVYMVTVINTATLETTVQKVHKY